MGGGPGKRRPANAARGGRLQGLGGQGLRYGDSRGNRCQRRGARIRKLGQLRGWWGNEAWGWGGGSHPVTSSPWSLRAREQRAFFDGSQHAPSFPGPSAPRLRVDLEGRERSDCECGHVRLLPRPHPLNLSCVRPSPQPYQAPKCLCQALVFRTSLVSALMEGWVGGRLEVTSPLEAGGLHLQTDTLGVEKDG